MPQQGVYVRNPPRAKPTNVPREPGQTRTQAGRLEYKDPLDNTWKPAVRLDTIRSRLIQEAPPRLYTHAKEKGYDATDVTTFLAKDQPYGSDRSVRDPLLFKITSIGTRGQKPTGYLTDGGLIVLDPFGHGIRDFPLVLPKCLSSNLGGYDIMNYFRQNEYMTLYDLMARMPNGYHEKNQFGKVTWHEGPPRYGTVGMRATRFRLQAGLLSWKRRMGSDAKNAKILSLIPPNCRDPSMNSTASHRDLTDAEQEAVKNVLIGTAPNRARNANKNDGNQRENEGNQEDSEATVEEVDEPDENEPLHRLQGFKGQNMKSVHFEDNADQATTAWKIPYRNIAPKASRGKSNTGQQTPTPEKGGELTEVIPTIANSTPGPYNFPSCKPSAARLPVPGSFETPIEVHEQSDRRGRDKISKISDDSSDSDVPLAKRHRATRPINGQDLTNYHIPDSLDGQTLVDASIEPEDYHDVNPGAQLETATGNMDEPNRLEAEAEEPQPSSLSNQKIYDSSNNLTTANQFANETASTSLEHSNNPTEIHTTIQPTDYRTLNPTTADDQKSIQQALELTRSDFHQKTNLHVPPLEAATHKKESYNAQRLRLQEMYARVWPGPGAVPELYSLPAWNGGFAKWRIADQEGVDLFSMC